MRTGFIILSCFWRLSKSLAEYIVCVYIIMKWYASLFKSLVNSHCCVLAVTCKGTPYWFVIKEFLELWGTANSQIWLILSGEMPVGTHKICFEAKLINIIFWVYCIYPKYWDTLTVLLLNMTCPVLANSVDPDQLASERSQLIWICTVCH